MGSPCLSGTILLDQIQVIVESHGRDTYDRALASLSPEHQHEIAALIAVSWIDVAVAMELKNAVARELGMDSLDFQRWVVRAAIERTISKFWRAILSLASAEAIAKRTPMLYRKTFNQGELAAIEVANGHATYELRGWHDVTDYDIVGIATGIEVALLHVNRRHGRVRIDKHTDVVHFCASWRIG